MRQAPDSVHFLPLCGNLEIKDKCSAEGRNRAACAQRSVVWRGKDALAPYRRDVIFPVKRSRGYKPQLAPQRQSTFFEILRRMPMLARVKNRLVPPEEMNGSGMPLVGSSERTTLMLKKA